MEKIDTLRRDFLTPSDIQQAAAPVLVDAVAGDKQVVDVEVGGAKGKIIATGENLTDVDDDISKTS